MTVRRSALCLLLPVVLAGACAQDPLADPAGAGTDDGGTDGTTGPDGGPACGRLTTPCAPGRTCEGPLDCASNLCRDGLCQATNPADGLKNGDETDVDCGGTRAPACADTKGCVGAVDCTSGVCKTGICQAPTPTDGVKNGDETGADCGGAKAPKCKTGEGCLADADCDKVKCDVVQKKCKAPAHDDGIKNGDETGIDCGGPTASKRCATGEGCVATADCDNVLCDLAATKLCLAAARDDGLKNGTETDIDCGGAAPTNAAKCATGKSCLLPADCGSDGCSYAKKCAVAPSCAPHEGGDTCGRGEVGQAGAVHESCCTSVPLPDNSARLDKYEITAGRVREFIKRTGGNVQQWVLDHRAQTAAQITDAMVAYLPIDNTKPVKTYTHCDGAGGNCASDTRGFGVYDHLGNTTFFPDRPCPNCGQGCYLGSIATGGYGHPTYYWDAATQSGQWSAQPRKFTQQELDVKSLNCVTQVLLASFCAWDGGRLATTNELSLNSPNSAWGTGTYPWGSNPFTETMPGAPGRIAYPYAAGNFLVPAENDDGTSNLANATMYNQTNWNPFSPYLKYFRYAYPNIPSAQWDQTDQAYGIAAPGRMYNDYRQVGAGANDGYYDIGGNIMEVGGDYTADPDDANHGGFPRANWTGGSFEGHGVNNRAGYNLNVLTKYGKMGGRCARSP